MMEDGRGDARDFEGEGQPPLSFAFRSGRVPVTYADPPVTRELARRALECPVFQRWVSRCEREEREEASEAAQESEKSAGPHGRKKTIEMRGVEIQSIDLFGPRIGFLKIKSDCTLVEEDCEEESEKREIGANRVESSARLPGICFLRGDAVCILVALFCESSSDEDGVDEDVGPFGLLVEQPRVPVGQIRSLELPAGMMDDAGSIQGAAVAELQEECGIDIDPAELVDLTSLAFSDGSNDDEAAGIAPSPGGCDERIRHLYLEKLVTKAELESMRGRLAGLRDHGELITVRVVPLAGLWRASRDAKAMISLFLLDRLREEGKLPPSGALAKPLKSARVAGSTPPPNVAAAANALEPTPTPSRVGPPDGSLRRIDGENQDDPRLVLHNGLSIPRLAFGTFGVPNDESGIGILKEAIRTGYRHFDTASHYGNEAALGQAVAESGVPRSQFYLSTKVWKDALRAGHGAVRESVEQSLRLLQSDYVDLVLIHWPVPGHFTDAYKELEAMVPEGKVKSLGLSNFNAQEYQEMVLSGIVVHPVVNQFEVSPFMFRPELVQYFQEHWIAVAASKSLNRATSLNHPVVIAIARRHSATPAQVMIRWSVQKGLIVVTKTSNSSRMMENRSVFHFSLSTDDMIALDSLTTKEAIRERFALEAVRKTEA